MLRPSPNHGTQRLPNDDDMMMILFICTSRAPVEGKIIKVGDVFEI